MKKRKILYISGSRADYGLMRRVLFSIKKHPNLEIEIVATGMHLMPKFGKTVNEIKKDGFKIHEINAIYEKDSKESVVSFVGKFIQLLTEKIRRVKPDIILLLGDRGEMLAGVIVGAYLAIPVAHIHGGDVSSTIDDSARHAITKLSHIHFPATKKSAERIIKMGEDSRRVFKVGAPGLDNILNEKSISEKEIAKKYNFDPLKPLLLVIQHSAIEVKNSAEQMKETMEAIKELGYQTVVLYPNADPGGRKIIKVIDKYKKYPFIKIYKSISHLDYLGLMRIASVMVGNSSSGIIEAPSFYLPVVNIGERQDSRERAGNVIEVDYQKNQIKKAIKKILGDKNFRERLKKCKNPYYGGGRANIRITKVLSEIEIDKKLLDKKINY